MLKDLETMNGEVEYGTLKQLLDEWFRSYVDRFRDDNGTLSPPLELKRLHSLRVADNARLIAIALNLPERERCLAEAAGLVHDAGRFPQYAEFGSFRDADTVDHGAYGRKVLAREDIGRRFLESDWNNILCAVEYHNRLASDVPGGLDAEQRRTLDIVQDADKLDIMELVLRSVVDDGFSELPSMLPQISLNREISGTVLKEALEMKAVNIEKLATLGDFLVMLATWFYDFRFEQARRLVVERRIPDRVREELPDLPGVDRLFVGMV
ncbi:MAG TPA: HD domain-containing protein [Deltaproteobacteria bacterium]|nr:HD domain-containing protein [Deltaproteobacteria bacterium]